MMSSKMILHPMQEKDLAVDGLTINAHRATAVDFTYPFWFEPTTALMNVSFAWYTFRRKSSFSSQIHLSGVKLYFSNLQDCHRWMPLKMNIYCHFTQHISIFSYSLVITCIPNVCLRTIDVCCFFFLPFACFPNVTSFKKKFFTFT